MAKTAAKPTTKKKPATPPEPKLKQFEVTAVIPTVEYGNIQPKLVVEAESMQDAERFAFPHIERIWNKYAQDGKKLAEENNHTMEVIRERLHCYLTGTEVFYDDIGHTYITQDGQKYLSGSNFAKQFEHEFQKHLILPRSAAKLNVPEATVDEYWTSKGDISTTFGTALHKALEHYGKFKELCELDGKGTGIHPSLLPIVEAFYHGRDNEQAVYEPMIADPKNLRCGKIDRFVITGEKRCIIEDFKTNLDLYKKGTPPQLKAPYNYLPNVPLSKYILQLSFYKAIVEAAGWIVEGLKVHHWKGTEWETIPLKPVDIDVPQEPIDVSNIV